MMKSVGTILATAIVTMMLAASAHAAETMRISLQLPLASHIGQNLLLFKKEVEARTKGEVLVEIYDSAQLYKDKEVPQAVGLGAIEAGAASLTRYVGDIPAVDIFYMPFLLNSEDRVRGAVHKGAAIRTAIEDAVEETGAKILYWQAYGGAVLLSKDEPIRTPDDLKGLRVRVFGKTLGDFVTATGGAPTLISGSEQYLAYQRGTVDVGMTGVSGVKSRRLWEVMDTITVTNHADIEFVVVANLDWWNSLSEDNRQAIEAAAEIADMAVRDAMAQIEADAFDAARENGMTVYLPTDTEIEAWKAASEPVYDAYRASAGDLGKKLLDEAAALN